MSNNGQKHPVMSKENSDLQIEYGPSKSDCKFLDKAYPSFGNILKNNKKSEEDPDFIGLARLEDGTPVRIVGITKATEKGGTTMPIRVFKIPRERYDNPPPVPNYISDRTKEFLS